MFFVGMIAGIVIGLIIAGCVRLFFISNHRKNDSGEREKYAASEMLFNMLKEKGIAGPGTIFFRDIKQETVFILKTDKIIICKYDKARNDVNISEINIDEKIFDFVKRYVFWNFISSGMYGREVIFHDPNQK